MERRRKNRTVADLNSINIVAAKAADKTEIEKDEEEEEEFVKYGAVDEFYDLDKEIGKGAYGIVKRCIHKEKKNVYAAKIIKTSSHNIRKTVMREIEVMRVLGRHNKLVELLDAYQTPFEMVMVLEFVPGGELFERIVAEEYLMEDDAVDYVKQILEALQFMHERNIVHLDLKPENILCVSMDSNDIKLVDFGLARHLDSEEDVKSSFGTPDFVAPEVIRMKPVSTASDLWSLGVVTYVLLSGLMPFSGDDDHQTLVKVAKADWDFDDDCFDDLSHDAMEFIEGLLVKEPSKRFTIEECFQHPWIKDTHETGTKINTEKHKAFMAKRRWKKSVNALLAVRRMSLSPLFAAKRRSSMDPKILKSTSESEEDQIVDRKASSPIDPAGLGLPNRRHGETRNSCFDLDINTIKALQAKADKAMGKDSSQGNEIDREPESNSEDEGLEDGSDMDDDCSGESENKDVSTGECSNAVNEEKSSYKRPRANTVCGGSPYSEMTSQRAERKTSQILISVGDSSKNDFKPVSFTFNTEELQKNNRLISQTTTVQNEDQLNSRDLNESHVEIARDTDEDSSEITPHKNQDYVFEPQKLTLQLNKSIVNDGNDLTDDNADELPTICVNDEVIVTSPPPIPVTLNNNIEKIDRQGLETTPSLQTSSILNIANVNKIPDGVQSITVKLENLNGVQFTTGHVSCGVRRSSTGSAPC